MRWAAARVLATVAFASAWHAAPTLAQTPPQTDRFAALLAQGDSAWTGRTYPVARTAYGLALSVDSLGSSRAVYRLGLLSLWNSDLAGAILLFRRYVRLEPRDEEGRIALARAYAWNANTRSAVALYDSILGRDRTYRDAALGAAQSLAWAGRFRDALGRYDQWLEANRRDVEAELARARTLAWAGRLKDSERAYRVIAERGEQLEATKGVALVAAWRGDLGRSERLWRALADRYPKDAEAWVGLAQVLRWAGRPEDARAALVKASAADPANADAAAQRRWVKADLAPAADPAVLASWDSDANRSVVVTGGVSVVPFARGRLTIGASHRAAELQALTGRSETARAALRVGVGSILSVTADLGAANTEAETGGTSRSRTTGTGGVTATVRLARWIAVGGHARRAVFDETAPLLWSGIAVTSAGGEGEITLTDRVALGAGGEVASLDGGPQPNERRAGFGALRWRAKRELSLSVSGRAFGYDVQAHDGYFAPSRYQQAEVGVRWSPGRDLGWAGWVDVGLGIQHVEFAGPGDSRGTQRFGVGLVRRPSPGTELGLEYGFSNVSATASTSGGSIYRSQVLGLRVRVVW